ncbi:MAG: virulence-related protein [Firmicutes bacterium]|nr:virulence-related protein [Bacillota bacterium]
MDRKKIVKALEEYLGVKSKYLGAPTFAYEVMTDDETYTIDREGKITTADENELGLEEVLNDTQNFEEPTEINEVEVIIPLDGHTGITLRNLVNMMYSKQFLIKKAFDITENIVEEDFSLGINEAKITLLEDFKEALYSLGENGCPGIKFDFQDSTITFKFLKGKWNVEKIETYSNFVAILNQKAKELKRVSPKVKSTDNEKYTFRTWLLRLGMIGDEYKQDRKVLLQNLSGNSAFRKEKPKKPQDSGE